MRILLPVAISMGIAMTAVELPRVEGFMSEHPPLRPTHSHSCAFSPRQDTSFRLGTASLGMQLQATINDGNDGIQRPQNEFSRPYKTERILGGGPRQKDYRISIEATEEEMSALAVRFDLTQISKLEADLNLRREGQNARGSRVSGVEVEGTVRARVTQTCVRTNENFDVNVEFPLFTVVRPIDVTTTEDSDIDAAELEAAAGIERKKKAKEVKSARSSGNINEMDVMELQKMLQDFDVEDDVIEDEAIYSGSGILDTGELVSQFFWLKLDPYPKKPGTGPIFASISG